MSNKIVVHKGRTNTIFINLGINVAGDVITSEIRAEPDQSSSLIATWDVAFVSDGSDGKLRLMLDDLITSQIKANTGYMDLKRMNGGEPLAIFDEPLEVVLRGTVTQ